MQQHITPDVRVPSPGSGRPRAHPRPECPTRFSPEPIGIAHNNPASRKSSHSESSVRLRSTYIFPRHNERIVGLGSVRLRRDSLLRLTHFSVAAFALPLRQTTCQIYKMPTTQPQSKRTTSSSARVPFRMCTFSWPKNLSVHQQRAALNVRYACIHIDTLSVRVT